MSRLLDVLAWRLTHVAGNGKRWWCRYVHCRSERYLLTSVRALVILAMVDCCLIGACLAFTQQNKFPLSLSEAEVLAAVRRPSISWAVNRVGPVPILHFDLVNGKCSSSKSVRILWLTSILCSGLHIAAWHAVACRVPDFT